MVRRLAWVGMPSARSLSASRDAVIGRPGRSPGNSQRLPGGDPIPDMGLAVVISLSNLEWLRNGHLVAAEAHENLFVAVDDLVGGHGGDPGLWLAEEKSSRRQPATRSTVSRLSSWSSRASRVQR